MKKILVLLLMTLPLFGCVAGVVVAGAAAGASMGGAVIYDKRNFKTMKADHLAHSIAMNHLNKDPLIVDHSHIALSVFNRVGLLVGQAQAPEVRDRAYYIVTHVKGIDRVYNEITIGPATKVMQRTNDVWIATKVRTMMLGKPGLQSTNLKVVTSNGVVYLMGVVSRSQADLAVDVARRVSGVVKVVKVFDYEA